MNNGKSSFGPIEECIYCGKCETELSKEHIIPYALGGKDILLKASCEDCQKITSKFELTVLRKELFQIRAKLGLPSRKSTYPKELPLIVELGGKVKTFYLPTTKYPTLGGFLEYPLPGVLGGTAPERGINVTGFALQQIGGPDIEDLKELVGSGTLTGRFVSHGNAFERMLAKIAFGYGVSEYGLGVVRNSPLRSIILGKSEDIGHWIGMSDPNPINKRTFHRVILEGRDGWILAKIRLFARMPEYLVVILEGDPQFRPQIAIPPMREKANPKIKANIRLSTKPNSLNYK